MVGAPVATSIQHMLWSVDAVKRSAIDINTNHSRTYHQFSKVYNAMSSQVVVVVVMVIIILVMVIV